jgi:predicted nucleic acid-binding protein
VKIVVDSYAWIEIFLGSRKGREAADAIQEAELVLTPGVVLAEIARKYLREGLKENVIRSRLRTIAESTEVAQIDEEVAIASSKAYLEIEEKARKSKLDRPSLFDAIVLGTARVNGGKVITGDPHFRNLPETVWLS